ncbi:GDP-mannose 4,6-dehydratase [Sulfuricurvum sp.]|uniref:NAD-dependent epimerase/dehydratase family protein n=1 Tax=Sulfuricurvum sp. TaxID=2025608 RepID=UPI00262E3C67|nr:GDP-mannose 4,6-dehydratase [Sulfuricurvum sp.]MDD2266032.1 GDP-mannose 4,6-dehydratase [Sulfuricurvum sp.]MDD2783044.1 GDP-mannose 4,6-dehydratase [Sulfuricurvum sp.]
MPIWIATVPASLFDSVVLLTGADGFTGRYLHRALEEAGARVVVLDVDLRDRDALNAFFEPLAIDYVVHLAAISFVPHGSDLDVYAVNLFGTQNLLEALSQTQKTLKKVILASTSNVYGNVLEMPITEALCPAPTNHYAISKLGMEHIGALYRDRFGVIVTRPFNYTGAGQADHFLIPKIVSHFIRKEPIIELGNIDVSRDFSDVRWIVEAYVGLLASECYSGVFNLASGTPRTIRSVIASLESLSGHAVQIVQNPAFIRSGEITVLCGSSQKLYDLIPMLPQPIPFEQTLEWMLNASQSMKG